MLQQTQVERVVPRYLALARALADRRRARGGRDRGRHARMAGARLQPASAQPPSRRARRSPSAAGRTISPNCPGVGATPPRPSAIRLRRDVLPVDMNVGRVQERTGHASAARGAQALIDLGATVCLARVPRCGVCPLAAAARRGADASSRCGSRRASRAHSASAAHGRCARARGRANLTTTRPSRRSARRARSRRPLR